MEGTRVPCHGDGLDNTNRNVRNLSGRVSFMGIADREGVLTTALDLIYSCARTRALGPSRDEPVPLILLFGLAPDIGALLLTLVVYMYMAITRLNPRAPALIRQVGQRYEDPDFRGVVALEEEARAVATRAQDPDDALFIYGKLGTSYDKIGQHAKAHSMHEEYKRIAEEVGNRAGVGVACAKLGTN
jgi:hypothetical protein